MSDETAPEQTANVLRLCNEIQLFDLCELENCSFRTGRFCTNEELLRKFESIREEDESPELVYDEEDSEEDRDDSDFDEYDDDYEGSDE